MLEKDLAPCKLQVQSDSKQGLEKAIHTSEQEAFPKECHQCLRNHFYPLWLGR